MADLFDDDDDDDDGARKARDEGMKRVEENAGGSWNRIVHRMVINLPIGWTGTSEDMRLQFTRTGRLPPPHHHNVWGPVTMWAKKTGLFVEVGRDNMKTTKSHARDTPIYRRVYPRHG